MNLLLASIALLILGTAVVAMSLQKIVHTALLLVVTWFGIAAFYLWAGAEFVAFAQVLVYAGAISMVVLFAVLLTRPSATPLAVTGSAARRGTVAIAVGAAVAATMVFAIVRSPLATAATPAPQVSVRALGEQLMGPHMLAVLIVGLILTAALIGAVVIAAQPKPSREEGRS